MSNFGQAFSALGRTTSIAMEAHCGLLSWCEQQSEDCVAMRWSSSGDKNFTVTSDDVFYLYMDGVFCLLTTRFGSCSRLPKYVLDRELSCSSKCEKRDGGTTTKRFLERVLKKPYCSCGSIVHRPSTFLLPKS